jgi:hypothetical protein
MGKRDTLVLPILFTARHAIELTLKFAVRRLEEAGILPAQKLHHDIKTYFDLLESSKLGDEKLRVLLRELKPFVESLDRVDNDGQSLRYHQLRDRTQSLADESLVNLETIRDGLARLAPVMLNFRQRIESFVEERAANSYTAKLSRRDLMEIADLLPESSRWSGPWFKLKKAAIKSRYGLSNPDFDMALEVIKANREMKASIGETTSLVYLPDALLISIIEKWRVAHPRRTKKSGPAIVNGSDFNVEDLIADLKTNAHMVSAVDVLLTNQQIAELRAIFSLGRNGGLPEFHEEKVQKTAERLRSKADRRTELTYLLDKTNLLDVLVLALRRLGRAALAAQLAAM